MRKDAVQMTFIQCPMCKNYFVSLNPATEHSVGGGDGMHEESYGLKCDACGAKGAILESWFAKKEV